MKYSTLFFILRGQPFHNGHKTVIDQALREAALVVIGLGSANRSRDLYNPWFPEEREIPIQEHYKEYWRSGRLIFVHLDDYLYNDNLWEENVQTVVSKTIRRHAGRDHLDEGISLIGLEKDGTSYYLKKFPQWGHVPVKLSSEAIVGDGSPISATVIRERFFGSNPEILHGLVPDETAEFLQDFRYGDEYMRLVVENQTNIQHQRPYRSLPHGHIDQTVDAVVIQSGHILMIERKSHPGKGLTALPGGYIKTYEGMLEACLRELTEEAGISFTEKPKKEMTERILRGSLVRSDRYGDVHRSMRGRIITEAFYFNLEERENLPWVRPGSDAKKAFWVPLSELKPREIFEDHYFIIQDMIRSKR